MATKPLADSIPPVEPTPLPPTPIGPTPVVAPPEPPAPPAVPAPPIAQYAQYAQSQPAAYVAPPAYGAAPYSYPQQPGQPNPAGYYPGYYAQPVGPRGLSIASMVLGIVGVLFGLGYGLGLFPSIAAIITGHIAQRRQPAGKGFWIAGLICGYVGLLASLIGITLLVVVIVIAANDGFGNIGTDTPGLGDN